MTIQERHAHRRRRRIVAAALVTTTLTACAQDPPKPKPLTAGSLDDRDFTRLRAAQARPHVVTPKPHRRRHVTAKAKPVTHVLGTLRTTKYCWTGNETASGKWPRLGMVATLSRSVPFGSIVRIRGLGSFVVEDRIGHGSDIDIYAGRGPSCEREAAIYGVRYLPVEIEAAA